jgi:hypothetical protein
MQATANEKQSASGGSIIANLQCIYRSEYSIINEEIPKGCCFFLSALSAERKKKLSALCVLKERSEPRWSGISAMLRWAVIKQQINTICITCF